MIRRSIQCVVCGLGLLWLIAGVGAAEPPATEPVQVGESLNDLVASPNPTAYYTASSQGAGNYGPRYAFDRRTGPAKDLRFWLSAKDDAVDQWLMADFRREFAVVRFEVWWRPGFASRNFAIQVSMDKTSWLDAATGLDGTRDNVTVVSLSSPVRARYVRMFQPGGVRAAQNPSGAIGVLEFRIYKQKDRDDGLINVAPWAESFSRPFGGCSLKYLNDDDPDTVAQLGTGDGVAGRYWLVFDRSVDAMGGCIDYHVYGRDAVMGHLEPRRDVVPHEGGIVLNAAVSGEARSALS